MSDDRKYRQRGYQDEPRGPKGPRGPKPPKPPQERAPGRVFQDERGPKTPNLMAAHEVFRQFGSYLLPQAFSEGCPLHPSYGAGHATVAGACVTILKAFFNESFVIPEPVIPGPDGHTLRPYTGPGADRLTVGGELNKLAANVALGRDFAGIHWRADYTESVKLGEAVAISILRDQRACYNEAFSGFTFTKFDGTTITI